MSLGNVLHRKITQYEWTGLSTTASPNGACTSTAAAQPFTDSAVVAAHAAQCTTSLQKELYDMTIACSEKKAYMIGGYDPHAHRLVRQVVEWDLNTRQWTRLCDIPEPLSQSAAIAYEDYCLVWGGWNGRCYSDTLWLLAPDSKSETKVSPVPCATAAVLSAAQPTHHTTSSNSRSHKDANNSVGMHWELLHLPLSTSSPLSSLEAAATVPADKLNHTDTPEACANSETRKGTTGRTSSSKKACASSTVAGPPGRCGHGMVLAMVSTTRASSPYAVIHKQRECTVAIVPATTAGGGATSAVGGGAGVRAANSSNTAATATTNNSICTVADKGVAELGGGDSSTEAWTSAAVEPVVYLFGGFDGYARRNDVWRLLLRPTLRRREAVWEHVVVCPGPAPSPRDNVALAFDMYEDRLVVFGGFSSTLMNDVWVLELHGEFGCAWHPVPVLGLPARRESALAMMFEGGKLLVSMGRGAHRECFAEFVMISLHDMRCALVSIDAASRELLAGRHGYVGCCGGTRGRRMLIYGGGDAQCYRSSMVEVEFDKADTSNKKSSFLR